jgi:hypothetical protein
MQLGNRDGGVTDVLKLQSIPERLPFANHHFCRDQSEFQSVLDFSRKEPLRGGTDVIVPHPILLLLPKRVEGFLFEPISLLFP